MRLRIFAPFVLILLAFNMTVFAQNEEPSDFELTATRIMQNSTGTSIVLTRNAPPTSTPDPFELTATGVILAATQTAVANGVVPMSEIDSGSDLNATATAKTQGVENVGNDGVESPLSFTLIAFGMVIFMLIIIGGVYILLAPRMNEKRK